MIAGRFQGADSVQFYATEICVGAGDVGGASLRVDGNDFWRPKVEWCQEKAPAGFSLYLGLGLFDEF